MAILVGDDTLKLWDIRSFKRPVNVVTGLDNMFAGTDCVFSPDEQVIMTGVSVKKGEVRREHATMEPPNCRLPWN